MGSTNVEDETSMNNKRRKEVTSKQTSNVDSGTPSINCIWNSSSESNNNDNSLTSSQENSRSFDSEISAPPTPTTTASISLGMTSASSEMDRNLRRNSSNDDSTKSISIDILDDDDDEEQNDDDPRSSSANSGSGSLLTENLTPASTSVKLNNELLKDTNSLARNNDKPEKNEQQYRLAEQQYHGSGSSGLKRSFAFGLEYVSKVFPFHGSSKNNNPRNSSRSATPSMSGKDFERGISQSSERPVTMNNETTLSCNDGNEKDGQVTEALKTGERNRRIRTLSVSKSNSESNIPMCHNSLGNLAEELPSSMSTDSSCILPSILLVGELNQQKHTLRRNSDPDPMTSDVIFVANNNKTCTTTTKDNSCIIKNITPVTLPDEKTEISVRISVTKNESQITNYEPLPCASTAVQNSHGKSDVRQLTGPKFKLILEGDVQVCKIKHGQNLMSKLTSCKLLRRWETHHIYLNDSCITSKTVSSITLYQRSQKRFGLKCFARSFLPFGISTKEEQFREIQ